MDLVFVCRESVGDSFLTNLLLAMEAKKEGKDVALLFTGEAIRILEDGVFRWSSELASQELRLKIVNNAAALGLPIRGYGVGRQIEVRQIIANAKDAGVHLFACSPWVELFGLDGKLPDGVSKMNMSETLKILGDSKVITF